jgi:uncharacterized protein (TIGR03435 family)
MLARIGIAFALAAGVAQTQTGAASSPAFEVASVKVSGPESKRDSGGGPGTKDPGQYHFNSASLLDLIAVAYQVDRFQVSSKTPVDKDRFDLTAKVRAGATKAEFREMLQNLLAERFHLKLHKESREFQAYELTVAKGGLKLKESTVDPAAGDATERAKFSSEGFPRLQPNHAGLATTYSMKDGAIVVRMSAQQQTMAALARALRMPEDLPIVDKTGLDGKYDFQLEFTKPTPAADGADSGLPDMFAALIRQAGLQLAPKKLPFDVLAIESFDKTPLEN